MRASTGKIEIIKELLFQNMKTHLRVFAIKALKVRILYSLEIIK